MAEARDLHQTVAVRLNEAGQRYTAGRRQLVEMLFASRRPLALPEILETDPSLPQSSAYRNLAALEAARVVYRVHGSDEFARFELAEDLAGHHHHLVCSNCGTVADFHASTDLEKSLKRTMTVAARRSGFEPRGHRLDVLGLCADCA
ncbi:MAG: transcriptional repressor [Actinobacteria bacterium]|nr:transcriptional repressor [Actinomycetota bacterium]